MKNIKVAVLQRAIPHYRLPILKQLNSLEGISLTVITSDFDINTSTGLPTENYGDLNMKFIKIGKFKHEILLQQIVPLRKFDVLIMDISINILTSPLYILVAKLSGVKVIGWTKGIQQELNSKENPIKIWYKKFIASHCDGLLLYGEISRNYYNKIGLINKPMVVAQNTIDTTSIAANNDINRVLGEEKRIQMGLNDKFIFGYFGKLTARKGVDKIILAFQEVSKKYSNAVLIIAGSGPSTQSLKKLVNDLDLDNSVIFMGIIPPGEEGTIMHFLDAFLSFSQGGLGILEAMASKCLIISTPELYPETELLEKDKNSLISNDFTISSFSFTMEKAITMGEERKILIENAYSIVMERATIEKMVLSFQTAIKKVIN